MIENGNGGSWGMHPRKAKGGGIKARSTRGEFAKNWWARRWIEAMERLVPGPRLTRGQHYARLGQVAKMEEIKNGVVALVQGSRPKPYKVTIQVTPFTRSQWARVLDVLGNQAIFTAQLLAGEMPENIEEVFSATGISLFPDRSSDLITSCTCPDKANPCKHIAAAHYILGDRFDEDPFLIFRLRGQSQDELLAGLRKRRGGGKAAPQPVRQAAEKNGEEQLQPYTQSEIYNFWRMGTSIENVNVQIRPPSIPQPLLKRLGEPEYTGQLSLQKQLEEAYDAMTQYAILVAFSDVSATDEEDEE